MAIPDSVNIEVEDMITAKLDVKEFIERHRVEWKGFLEDMDIEEQDADEHELSEFIVDELWEAYGGELTGVPGLTNIEKDNRTIYITRR